MLRVGITLHIEALMRAKSARQAELAKPGLQRSTYLDKEWIAQDQRQNCYHKENSPKPIMLVDGAYIAFH